MKLEPQPAIHPKTNTKNLSQHSKYYMKKSYCETVTVTFWQETYVFGCQTVILCLTGNLVNKKKKKDRNSTTKF